MKRKAAGASSQKRDLLEARISYEQLRAAACTALTAKLGPSYSVSPGWTIIATFDNEVIVERGPTQLERYPVTLDSFGKVTLGDVEAVEIVYQGLKENAGARILGPIAPGAELSEAERKEQVGRQWAVVLIQEGLSGNRRLYTASALRGAAKLFESKPAYWTHTASMKAEPDPRDQAGFFRNCRAALLEGSPSVTAITATFHATDPQARQRLVEAFEADNPDQIGISINAEGRGEMVRLSDGPAFRVDAITKARSADLVAEPAAGGRFMRLVAGMGVEVTQEDLMTFEQKLAKLRESAADLAKSLSAQPTEGEVDALIRVMEARAQAPAPAAPAPALTTMAAAAAPAPAAAGETISLAEVKQLRQLAHRFTVDQALAGRTMPEPLKVSLRESLLAREGMNEAQVKSEVDRFVEASAKLTAPAPQGTGLAVATQGVGDEATKFAEALEGFFFEGASDAVRAQYKKDHGKDAPRSGFGSLKEIYEAATGDRRVSGLIEAKHISRYAALMEGVKAHLTEAIGTGTLTNAFAATMNRRLVSEYRSAVDFQKWRLVVSNIQPLADFRNQERVRFGHLGDLPIVSQASAYTELTDPTDEKVTYAPAKRGAIVSITREAIKNDDVGIVRAIPMRLALSAARTLQKFVFDFIITNPTLDDAVALFAAATTRGSTSAGNIHTTALSDTNVGVARQRLLRVQDKDGKTALGIAPKILLVPPELESLGYRLTTINVYPVSGQNATEPNLIRERYGLSELIVLETMSDVNDWFILGDPRMVDTIEVGFVDGQQDPLILVQDQETVGNVFTGDKMSMKVRHEYGADVVDWRGMQGGIVP